MKPILDRRLEDADADQVRRSHADAIRELQALPAAGEVLIPNVSLVSGAETPIAHKLGRAPVFVQVSVVSGAVTAGIITEFRTVFSNGAPVDRTKIIVLQASGYGATVRVDVLVR